MKKFIVSLAVAVLLLGLSGVAMATYTITDDATGGDCTQIGTWDAGTKTCTLTRDIHEFMPFSWDLIGAITIDSDYVTVDGNGHMVSPIEPLSFRWGVLLPSRKGATVKNLIIKNFFTGIGLYRADNNIVSDNIVTNNTVGISINGSYNSVMKNNFLDNSGVGISHGGGYSVYPPEKCTGNVVTNNKVSNSYNGIYYLHADYNILAGNIISECEYGVYSFGHWPASFNTMTGNTFENNSYGVCLWFGNDYVYNNNFINNYEQAFNKSDSIFNIDVPIGGNYWNNYDNSDEGCNDQNSDGFCDAPYYTYDDRTLALVMDYLPWTKPNGWIKAKSIKDVIASIADMVRSGDITDAEFADGLIATLNNASDAESRGAVQASRNMIQAFMNRVAAQKGKHISDGAADNLIATMADILGRM